MNGDNDNPHYVTLEEAGNKICVQAMQIVLPLDEEAVSCAGPKCMAWRWKCTVIQDEDGRLVEQYSTTHGFCGMVRI